jgi:hypothetical protein
MTPAPDTEIPLGMELGASDDYAPDRHFHLHEFPFRREIYSGCLSAGDAADARYFGSPIAADARSIRDDEKQKHDGAEKHAPFRTIDDSVGLQKDRRNTEH